MPVADGSARPIESLRVGDRVRGRGGRIDTVLGVARTRLGRRRLWSINGSRPFVTAEHPFLGPDGWRAIDPGATALENPLLPVRPLARGDRLLRLVEAGGPSSAGALALATRAEPIEEALERRASGEAVAWRAPSSGRTGTVVPLRTLKAADGRYCRDYRETVAVSGKARERTGRACREASGLWRRVPIRA